MDRDDWAAALDGDGEAFSRIFDRHRSRIRRHAHRLVPVSEDAEDVVAIVFLEAWRRRDAVRLADGSLLPWLLVTATNVARNVSRASRRYDLALSRLPTPAPWTDESDDADARRALASLSLDDRRVITLCVLYELPVADVAAVLGVAVGTVKSRLSRAKRRLAARLDQSAALSTGAFREQH